MATRETTEKEVRFTIPARVARALQEGDEALSREAREAFILALHQQGRISGGFAAEALELQLRDYYELVKRRGLPLLNYEEEDFERELGRLRDKAAKRAG